MPKLGLHLIASTLDNTGLPNRADYLCAHWPFVKDQCIIGNRGKGWGGKPQWHLSWYRNGVRISTSDRHFESPEEALAAVENILEK